ncbi:MAG: TIGR04133 family radical SAM/SPASM protein [Bacteroidales bacterium]|nr:TIGR04133 family radical SAM/SPASM protein [Bacteroidales bacterium]
MNNRNISFKKRLTLNVFKEYRKTEISLHELQYLFWECTHRCNLQCIHCGSDCKQNSIIPDMPASDFLQITEIIKTQYRPNDIMIIITGGEPLMRKDLEFCGTELTKQGYPWGMVTNGVLLSQQRLNSLLSAGLQSITVSLDGLETTHNWIRNKKCYLDVIRAIKLLVEKESLVFDVVTCINQKNFSELNEIKDLLISLGVKRWRLFTISPIGRAKSNSDLLLNDQQFTILMEFIKDTRQERQIEANYECEGFVGNYEMEVRDGYYFCRAGINVASILVDGSISACPNIDGRYSQGNIYKTNFLDIWNNQFKIMRQRDWMKTGICKQCEVFKWCVGNGMHLRDFDSKNVLCCQYNMLNN